MLRLETIRFEAQKEGKKNVAPSYKIPIIH